MSRESRPLAKALYAFVRPAGEVVDNLGSPPQVLLGLSGGGDSVALFHVLLELKRQGRVKSLKAAHVNHGWRGAESNADERFCRDLCRRHGVPLAVHCSPAKLPRTEEAARTDRHRFFRKKLASGGWVALAHNRDDQAETVLWRICRGTGPDGLAGLREIEAPFVRPLLGAGRGELRTALKAAGLEWRDDSTNSRADRTRTFVRLSLMPELEKVHPGASRHLAELARRTAETAGWAAGRAEGELEFRRLPGGGLSVFPWGLGPLVGRELIARWWRLAKLPESGLTDSRLREIEALIVGETAGPVPAPGGREIVRKDGTLRLRVAGRRKTGQQ